MKEEDFIKEANRRVEKLRGDYNVGRLRESIANCLHGINTISEWQTSTSKIIIHSPDGSQRSLWDLTMNHYWEEIIVSDIIVTL